MISKQAQEEQTSYYYHLCALISTRQKSDKSPLTPLHSLSLSPNPPFQCGGFVASEPEGCARRAVRGVCWGLWAAGCRRCPSGSGTPCSAERGSGPDGWHRNKKKKWKADWQQFYYLNAAEGVISMFGEALVSAGKALDLLVLSVFPFLNAPEHFSGCQKARSSDIVGTVVCQRQGRVLQRCTFAWILDLELDRQTAGSPNSCTEAGVLCSVYLYKYLVPPGHGWAQPIPVHWVLTNPPEAITGNFSTGYGFSWKICFYSKPVAVNLFIHSSIHHLCIHPSIFPMNAWERNTQNSVHTHTLT